MDNKILLNNKKEEVIEVNKSESLILKLDYKEKNDLDKTIYLDFVKTQISADIKLRLVQRSNAKIKLMIIIRAEKGIEGISSVLDMKALQLSKHARLEFVPSLEIDERDVSVDHRSTLGIPDENQLNYLQSRGATRDEAIELLAQSFFND